MARFIESNNKDGKRMYLNVNHIVSVQETGENRCLIITDIPPANDSVLPFYYTVDAPYDEVVEMIEDCIDNQPTADVAEVKHGKWIDRYSEKYDNHLFECSECRKKALYDAKGDELGHVKITQVLSPVCPWCGAKMDE
jgi:rubrerythrin